MDDHTHGIPPVPKGDSELLANLGYKQELKRDFSALEVFGISFSIIGVLPGVTSVLIYAVPYGGPVSMVWGWAVCSFFLVFIALAIAELGSAVPTAGGLYFWTFMYSSPKYRNLLSWIVGYSNTITYMAGTAGVDWACAVQIMAVVSIGSDMTFVATTAQTFGLYAALLLCHAILASSATRIIARMQNVYIAVNVLLCIAVIAGIPAATRSEFRNPASYAFGGFENLSSWPDGYAFILSFLAPLWVVGGFDSSLHISEEARNANVAVPWATMCATVLGSVLGWVINVVLVFNIGTDLESIANNPIGQPMLTILFNSFGKHGTIALWSFVIVTQFIIGISFVTASSRQIWAFSRDGALPFSKLLYRVNTFTGTPVNAVWFSAACSLLLGLLAFAGPAAVGAVFTLGVVAQYLSYIIPISARFLGGQKFNPGPFSLGVASRPVAIVAVSWMTFMGVVLLFPSTPQVAQTDMNYTVVVLGGVLCLATAYYYLPVYGGSCWFQGPVANIDIHTSVESASSSEGYEDKVVYHVTDASP
ncbi:putative amino-acid permease PB24D3.02c [Grifola frondosa]|uniref:Putative amino-acid permease PB24D3.02c n=1 Tax=Grifola frondosa TaxID=5627 RepID=A0A1C7LTL6_GRIFR|nr:putative amino-acid permease PB24D3.02c [Grifola frondosa]